MEVKAICYHQWLWLKVSWRRRRNTWQRYEKNVQVVKLRITSLSSNYIFFADSTEWSKHHDT